MDIKKQDFIKAALKQPPLFYQSPETLNANVSKSSELMDIKKQDFIKAALKQPQLFYQLPETLFKNFKTLAILFDNDYEQTRQFFLKNPMALTYSQERDFIHYIVKKITGKKLQISKNPQGIIQDYFKKQKPDEYLEIKQFPIINEYLIKKLENNEITLEQAKDMVTNEKLLGEFMLLRAIEHFGEESKQERREKRQN